ncbi:MAG: hypothetical protein L6Q92_08430 [Phycisphaerae bacterium]|nr:hypothetical protein [Phycisphaerae bacterium]
MSTMQEEMAMTIQSLRTRTSRPTTRLVLAALSFALCRESKARAEELSDLFAQFQSLSSIAMTADVTVVVDSSVNCLEYLPPDERPLTGSHQEQQNPDTTTVTGRYEFWADADRYRVNSYLDPAKLPGMQTEVAFDGFRFQLLLSNGTLSYASRDHSTLLPVLQNPLLELLQFRYPLTDETRDTEIRLKDVVRDQVSPEFWAREWTTVEIGDRKLERAEFPGGRYEGHEYVHHVFAMPGQRSRPIRIDRVSDRRLHTASEFLDYRQADSAAGPAWWPHRIILRAFSDEGETVGSITFVINYFRVDGTIPDSTFRISPTHALRVWDDDARQFVRSAPVATSP